LGTYLRHHFARKPEGVIVQLGGQTALKLAEKLERYGIKIIGTDFKSLDLAEDRGSFSNLLKANNIPYPKFGVIEDAEEAIVLSKIRISFACSSIVCIGWTKHEDCN
jgi:carbamoylphosphate synthase large subunit